MTAILAIDPGPKESAWLRYEDGVREFGMFDNETVRATVANYDYGPVVIEKIECYGMSVGAEVFETCMWIGRFKERAISAGHCDVHLMPRRDVKLHLCGSARAKDANIRQRLIDLHGGKDVAIGTKRSPGPLYGIRSHLWSALALAVTYRDTRTTDYGMATD